MTACGKQSFQHPQRTIMTEGGKQPCAGSTLGGTRAMRFTRVSHPARVLVQPRGYKLGAWNPAAGQAWVNPVPATWRDSVFRCRRHSAATVRTRAHVEPWLTIRCGRAGRVVR